MTLERAPVARCHETAALCFLQEMATSKSFFNVFLPRFDLGKGTPIAAAMEQKVISIGGRLAGFEAGRGVYGGTGREPACAEWSPRGW